MIERAEGGKSNSSVSKTTSGGLRMVDDTKASKPDGECSC